MTAESDAMASRLREARVAAGYASPTDAARAIGTEPPTYLGHENGSRGFRATAPRYADFFKVNLEWLLTGRGPMKKAVEFGQESLTIPPREHPVAEINVPAMPRDLPILGSGAGGEDGLFEFNGQVIDYARRPPRLASVKDAYALHVAGDSMSPWRENGQLVYVHPHLPVQPGDYVVVQLKPEREGSPCPAYVKRLLRRTMTEIRLLQYNPREEKPIPTKRIASIHRIIDWSELMGL